MTLSRKIALHMALLTVGVGLLGAGVILTLRSLHERVTALADERAAWTEVHRAYITDVGAPILVANQFLHRQPPEAAAAGEQLRAAAVGLSRIELPANPPADLTDAFERARLSLRRALDRLHRMQLDEAPLEPDERSLLRAELDDVRSVAAHLTAQIRSSYDAVDAALDRQVTNTTLGIAALAAVMILGAAIISVWQHRSVMRPIRRVTAGVRRGVTGRFDQRLDATGDDELARLARDFNQMAEQLEALYRDLEDRVRAASRELVRAERLASVGYLAAGVAHEINNPLGIIAGRAELAMRKLEDDQASEPQRRALQIICEEAFRCKAITQKLLSLSRGSDEAREPVDMAAVAREVVDMALQLPRLRDRKVEVNADDARSIVQASGAQMKQVLLNLVINALDAAGDSGSVRIDVHRRGERVVVQVADDGAGMDEATLGRVFEPFFTARRGAADEPGTGLGLSIVHAIVADHGGTIRAASEGPGRGSTFTVELPAGGGAGTTDGHG